MPNPGRACVSSGTSPGRSGRGAAADKSEQKNAQIVKRRTLCAIRGLLFKTIQHQVFGNFSGKVILDDGTELEVDNFPGFAEDVLNWW